MNVKDRQVNRVSKPLKWTVLYIVIFLLLDGPNNVENIYANIQKYFNAGQKVVYEHDIEGAVSEFTKPNNQNENSTNCSDLNNSWEPDANTTFEGNKIKLKNNASAGAILLKEDPSTFLNLQMKFRSSMVSGINTNISFRNGNDEIKYAIGDGDFKTVRYYRSDNNGPTYILEDTTKLDPPIDNQYNIGFTMNIIEQIQGNKMLGSLVYGKNREFTTDLKEILIKKPERIFLSLGFGLDTGKEPENSQEVYIEMVSCEISEIDKSKVLNQ